MDTRTKILRLDQALEAAAQFRRQGRRLHLAAGAFDVLQAAHAEFLSGLRSDGDALFVAVYDDGSLGQPVLSEPARAQLVAALRAVDYVLIWPESRLGELRDQFQVDRIEPVPLAGRNIIGEVLDRHK
jgi:bifunctional ADP-heptose synthase (sugar kinase/adenylyltransferase)